VNSSNPINKFIIGGLVLSIAVAANFLKDSFGFIKLDKLLLNLRALNNFLQALGLFISGFININTVLSLVVYIVNSSNRTLFTFNNIKTYMFKRGIPINIMSY
jgi:hypothetical protein